MAIESVRLATSSKQQLNFPAISYCLTYFLIELVHSCHEPVQFLSHASWNCLFSQKNKILLLNLYSQRSFMSELVPLIS